MTGPETVASDDGVQRRERVTGALRERSAQLAGMYSTALRELDSAADSGNETARVSVICHCMRELMNGLPAILAASVMPRPNPSSSSLASRLPELLAEHPDLDLRAQQDMVPVPNGVTNAIASLVDATVRERGLNLANAAALLTDGADASHPMIGQWKAAQAFFLQWTHLDRNPDGARELPSDEEITVHVRVVEDAIEVRTSQFFTNLGAVEDLLQVANAQEGRTT